MKRIGMWGGACLLGLFWAATGSAQQPLPAEEPVVVAPREIPGADMPRLIKFSGVLKDAAGQPRIGVVGLTFALYAEADAGVPLWLETQNVELDTQGRYTVLLGLTQPEGLPLQLFAANEARWLGIQVQGEEEPPRLLLVSVPYALKAEEAERLAGKEASAFVLVEQLETQVREEIGKQSGVSVLLHDTKKIDTGASTFTANNATQVVNVTQQGTGLGLRVTAPVASAILGLNTAPSGGVAGLRGESASPDGVGIFGRATSTTGVNTGVRGESSGSIGRGIVGTALSTTGATIGIRGVAFSPSGTGISALVDSTTGTTTGLAAEVRSPDGVAARFKNTADGKLLSGVSSGGEVFSVGGSGTVTATAFVGDGSGLTGIPSSAGGTVTQVDSGAGLTGGPIIASGTLSVVPALRTRNLVYLAGCDSCTALTDGDDQDTFYVNLTGTMTIESVTCFSDAGTPTINLQRDDGVPANILSSNLSCAASGATTTVFAGSENIVNLNDRLDFVVVSAGGVAKRATVVIKAVIN